MKTEIKQTIQVASEKIEILRFAFDEEVKKMQVDAINNKYNSVGELINKEPIRLLFRDRKYKKAMDFCLNSNMADKVLQMLLRKLEIDRKLSEGSLCDPLPEGVPPYPNEDDNG